MYVYISLYLISEIDPHLSLLPSFIAQPSQAPGRTLLEELLQLPGLATTGKKPLDSGRHWRICFSSGEQDMCHYVDVTCLTYAQNMIININQPSLVLAI